MKPFSVMELTTKQVHQAIDKILPFFVNESSAKDLQLMGIRQIQLINPNASNQVNRVFSIMEDHNLVNAWSKDSYELTEFGKEVLENGGWLKYRTASDFKSAVDEKIQELTLKQLKYAVWDLKYWWVKYTASAILGAGMVKLLDYFIKTD